MLNKRLRTSITRSRGRSRRKNWFRIRLNDGPRLGTQYDLFAEANQGRYYKTLSSRLEPQVTERSEMDE